MYIYVDKYKISISISSDGNIVAISSIRHSSFRGHVRVYEYNGIDTWIQIGADIDVAGIDQSGFSIQLSNNASRIIIGAIAFNSNRGVARVYENQVSTWTQIGQNITGEASSDQSGFSVSISGNGDIIAVGAPFNDAGANNKGHVRIFNFNNVDTWQQIGDDIDGENNTDRFGGAVSLNDDGTILAAGAVLAKNETNISQGHIRVFQNQNGIWNQVGVDIDGENQGDFFGESLSISSNGTIIAAGSIRNDNIIGNDAGHVRVFDFSQTLSVLDNSLINFSVYPNPTTNQFTIQLQQGLDLENVSIFNELGQFIMSSKQIIINTSNLSQGIYFLEVKTNKGSSIQKLIIE